MAPKSATSRAKPAEVTTARAEWLEAQLEEVRAQRLAYSVRPDDPDLAQHWRPTPTATTACLAEERRLRQQLDEVRLELARIAEAEHEASRTLTDDERAAALAALVDSASEPELEVAVREWLRRRRYRLHVDEGGTLEVVPLGESGPTLRVVG